VRYGNVIGSRGSVIPLFKEQQKNGRITITDPRMTRFWITLNEAVELVIQALHQMQGGEIFVPRLPSMKIIDLAQAIAPACEIEFIGIRPGEKLHEVLITEEEGRNTVANNGMYVVLPNLSWWKRRNYKNGSKLPEGFVYSSKTNEKWLTVRDLEEIIQSFLPAEKDPLFHFSSLVHDLKAKFVLNLINSEENIPERDFQKSATHE
jgi:UDP-N-acetylglucosamine 4,6-dehydratase